MTADYDNSEDFAAGYDVGYEIGFDDGYEIGFDGGLAEDGYEIGFDDGLAEESLLRDRLSVAVIAIETRIEELELIKDIGVIELEWVLKLLKEDES